MSSDLSTLPAMRPPPGVVPNFHNPENMTPLIHFILGICVALSTVIVLVRLWTRLAIIRKHGWEDYTILLAWGGFVGYVAVAFEAIQYGSGVHQWNVPMSDFIVFLKLANVMEVYYNPLIFVTKLAILLQYLSIFVPTHKGKTFYAVQTLIWLNFAFYLAVMLVQIMTCLPREKIWNPLIPGRCVNLGAVLIAGAVINIVSDLSILVLPIGKIWQLKISNARKWGISAVFATGLFACISSILRLVGNVKFADTEDVTYDLTTVALWTIGEITSGILCACLPVLPQFFRQSVPKLRSTLGSTFLNRSYGRSNASSNISKPSKPFREEWESQGSYVALDSRKQEVTAGVEILQSGTQTAIISTDRDGHRHTDHDSERGFPLRGIQKTVTVEAFGH